MGSATVIGSVSPPGADFSEPVTQATLRIVDVLYSLDVALANKRHFPTINWLQSYSLYADSVDKWWNRISPDYNEIRDKALITLQREAELEEIVRLVGPEALPEDDRLVLLAARMIREDFLMQSAYHPVDTYTEPKRTHMMLSTIMKFYSLAEEATESGMLVSEVSSSKALPLISRMKDIPNEEFDDYMKQLWSDIDKNPFV